MKQNIMPKRHVYGAVAGLFLCWAAVFSSNPARAQGSMPARYNPDQTKDQTDSGPIAQAFDYVAHNSYFRVGAQYFQYFGSSTAITSRGPGAQLLAANPIPHSGSSVGNKLSLGATYGLFIPETGHHLAFELALAPPLLLDFQAKGAAGRIGEKPPFSLLTGGKAVGQYVGDFKALPPSFTFVFRPWTDTVVQPYIGVGAMYLYTYDAHVRNSQLQEISAALGGGGHPSLYLSKPVACVGQLGADFNLPGNVFLSADVRYVGCADVRSTLNLGNGNKLTSNNHFHAMIYQVSLGIGF
jgi:outer membrane protein W